MTVQPVVPASMPTNACVALMNYTSLGWALRAEGSDAEESVVAVGVTCVPCARIPPPAGVARRRRFGEVVGRAAGGREQARRLKAIAHERRAPPSVHARALA